MPERVDCLKEEAKNYLALNAHVDAISIDMQKRVLKSINIFRNLIIV